MAVVQTQELEKGASSYPWRINWWGLLGELVLLLSALLSLTILRHVILTFLRG
jgi:hypothetical protein